MEKYRYDHEHGKNMPTKPKEVAASSLDPASLPLRVHIFAHTGASHYNAPSQSTPDTVLLARATRHRQTQIPSEVCLDLIPRAKQLSHPGV